VQIGLSLVDPDNRLPVDFELRRRWLAEPRPIGALLGEWRSGQIKQQLIARTLAFRRRQPTVFSGGDYLPLSPRGAHADRIVAFARRTDRVRAVVVVPRLVAPLLRDRELPLPAGAAWADTEVELPEGWPGAILVDELTGRRHAAPHSGGLAVAELLAELPDCAVVDDVGRLRTWQAGARGRRRPRAHCTLAFLPFFGPRSPLGVATQGSSLGQS
jgi:(1->4)-alpha-D-glucan 1-alpha-D-glucosylmutase